MAAAVREAAFINTPAVDMTWGRRIVSSTLDSNSVLTLSVYLSRVPFHFGIPLWLIVAEASTSLTPASQCFTRGIGCGSLVHYRICFNSGNAVGMCDEVSNVPLGSWVAQSRHLPSRFASKYGQPSAMPATVVVFLGMSCAGASCEAYVDDMRVVSFSAVPVCASLTAASLGQQSATLAIPAVSAAWTLGTASGNLSVAVDGAALRARGTVTPGLNEAVTYAVSKAAFAGRRVSSFQLRVNAATTNSSASSAVIRMCGLEAQLVFADGMFQYLHASDGYFRVPPPRLALTNSAGSALWTNSAVEAVAGLNMYSDTMTYAFFLQINGLSNNYAGIFARSGATYTNAGGTVVTGGMDRVPGLWQQPSSLQIIIRMSTNTNYDDGCDPQVPFTLGRWTHVAIVFRTDQMDVYYDGIVVCSRNWANAGMIMQNSASGRAFYFGGIGSATGNIAVNGLKWYDSALNSAQVVRLLTKTTNVDEVSHAYIGAREWCNVTCVLQAGTVSVFENGALKMSRGLFRPSAGASSGEGFAFEQVGGATLDAQVRYVRVAERVEAPGTPVYCSATGNFYQVVEAPGVSFMAARLAADAAVFLKRGGHLTTLASSGEYDCVMDLLACESVWVDGASSGGLWAFTVAPNVGQAPFARWAAGEPSGSSAMNFSTVHSGGCIGAVRRGEMAALGPAWGGASGYVVEYETPDDFAVDYGVLSAGASILSTSSVSDSVPWLTTSSVGAAIMGRNLIQSIGVPAVAATSAADSRFVFQFRDGDADQFVVVALQVAVAVNRIGAVVGIAGASHRVVGPITISTSTLGASGPWTTFATLQAPILNADNFAFSANQVTVQWVRFAFGGSDGGTGSRVVRLRVQLVRPTFARMFVNESEVFSAGAGLKVARVSSSFAVKSKATFPMTVANALNPVATYVTASGSDDYILTAQQDPATITAVLFRDTFDTVADLNGPMLEMASADRALPYATHADAADHCFRFGWTLCEKKHVCRPAGYGWRYGSLFYGRRADALYYMPVADAPDAWVAVGNAFTSDEICGSYEDLNAGDHVSDALARNWYGTMVSCCAVVAPSAEWDFTNLGVFSNTGDNHTAPWLGGDDVYPPHFMRQGSTLVANGYGWGSPLHPSFTFDGTVFQYTTERCTVVQVCATRAKSREGLRYSCVRREAHFCCSTSRPGFRGLTTMPALW